MAKKTIITMAIGSLLLGGCAGFFQTGEQLPLSWVIAEQKYELQKANSQALFEEFVRYNELGKRTVALYKFKEGEMEVSTSWGQNTESRVAATVGLEPTAEVGQTLTVNKNQAGKVNIKFEPVGNSTIEYRTIKDIFGKADPSMYKLLYTNANSSEGIQNTNATFFTEDGRKLSSQEVVKRCNDDTYCFYLSEKDRTHSRIWYAYLDDQDAFLTLLDALRDYNPPPTQSKQEGKK